jgi:hypothetical protein
LPFARVRTFNLTIIAEDGGTKPRGIQDSGASSIMCTKLIETIRKRIGESLIDSARKSEAAIKINRDDTENIMTVPL